MLGNRVDFGRSIFDDDERPISGQPTREDFVKALTGYLTSMQERCPDVKHTNMEWMTNGFSMIALNPDQSVPRPPVLNNLEGTVREAVRHKMLAIW